MSLGIEGRAERRAFKHRFQSMIRTGRNYQPGKEARCVPGTKFLRKAETRHEHKQGCGRVGKKRKRNAGEQPVDVCDNQAVAQTREELCWVRK